MLRDLNILIFVYRFRQYGLWERYTDLYPDADLVYTVGVSDYGKDWFFAHVTRFYFFNLFLFTSNLLKFHLVLQVTSLTFKKSISGYTRNSSPNYPIYHWDACSLFLSCRKTDDKDNQYQPTTWQIKFQIDNIDQMGTYKLRVALASANFSELQVFYQLYLTFNLISFCIGTLFCWANCIYQLAKIRFNDSEMNPPHFTTRLIGRDNAIARHGIHGLYWLFNVDVQRVWLVEGDNTIYLTQSRSGGPFRGIMYDYIRMEGPPPSNTTM